MKYKVGDKVTVSRWVLGYQWEGEVVLVVTIANVATYVVKGADGGTYEVMEDYLDPA